MYGNGHIYVYLRVAPCFSINIRDVECKKPGVATFSMSTKKPTNPLRVAVGGLAPRAHDPRPHQRTFARTLRPHLTIYMDAVLGRAGVGGQAVVYDGL